MLGSVVVVGVEHDEQGGTIAVVVVTAGLGQAVAGLVGGVEVVAVVGIQRVMVADGGGNRQAGQDFRVQVGGVLLLLGLAGFVDLVAAEMTKFRSGFCSAAISRVRFQP